MSSNGFRVRVEKSVIGRLIIQRSLLSTPEVSSCYLCFTVATAHPNYVAISVVVNTQLLQCGNISKASSLRKLVLAPSIMFNPSHKSQKAWGDQLDWFPRISHLQSCNDYNEMVIEEFMTGREVSVLSFVTFSNGRSR